MTLLIGPAPRQAVSEWSRHQGVWVQQRAPSPELHAPWARHDISTNMREGMVTQRAVTRV